MASPSRKLARSSLNLSPSSPNLLISPTKKTSPTNPTTPPIPVPDYEDRLTKAESRKENGDLWGNARRSSKKANNMVYPLITFKIFLISTLKGIGARARPEKL